MTSVVLDLDGMAIVEITGGLARPEDATEVISACYAAGADRALVEAQALPPEFFALQTRFAGEFLQKLVNYGIRLAGVFPDESAYSERFRELLLEARRGASFRAFASRDDAERWLSS